MKISFLGILVWLIQHATVFAQIDTLANIDIIIKGMENALLVNDSLQYKTEMRFREFGQDTFEIRNFSIHYKSNTHNELYGYDYALSEVFSDGFIFTFMALDESFYRIDESSKTIFKTDLPKTIDLGSYFEYMKSNSVISDVFDRFIFQPPTHLTFSDSNHIYIIQHKMSEVVTNQIFVDKVTFLPFRWRNIIRNNNFDLTQTLEVSFIYENQLPQLRDSAFSLNHYLSNGYSFKQPKVSNTQPESQIDSGKDLNAILNYSFIKPNGDTSYISELSSKYILLDFWYTSCLPCLKAIPIIDSLGMSYATADLEIIGVNCFDKNIKENLEVKFKNKITNMKFLYGSKDLLESLRISSFPSYFLVFPDRSIKPINGGIDDVINMLETILQK